MPRDEYQEMMHPRRAATSTAWLPWRHEALGGSAMLYIYTVVSWPLVSSCASKWFCNTVWLHVFQEKREVNVNDGSRRSVLWKYFVACDAFSCTFTTCVHFLFPSTTIRIRIQPNTTVNYWAFGQILKTHIRYSPMCNT